MAPGESNIELPIARPLPPEYRLERLTLKLSDGYQTSVFRIRPKAGQQAARRLPVVYVHGIQSHPGWFVSSAAMLAGEGRDVFLFTRRGSGDNVQARGDAPSAGQLLDDVRAAREFALAGSGADRCHLVGVSWGGKLLAAYVASGRAAHVASLTMIAPGICPRVDVSGRTKLAIALSLAVSPRRPFDIPLNQVELFTENEEMRDYLRRDPLRLHRATARFLYASRRLDRMLAKSPKGAISVPTALILASRDRIIDNGRTTAIIERLTAGKAAVDILEGAHTLEFEADTGPFFETLRKAIAAAE
ncbi:MAG: alpha/beta fold hydrolase [Phycisphaerae bacterium]